MPEPGAPSRADLELALQREGWEAADALKVRRESGLAPGGVDSICPEKSHPQLVPTRPGRPRAPHLAGLGTSDPRG